MFIDPFAHSIHSAVVLKNVMEMGSRVISVASMILPNVNSENWKFFDSTYNSGSFNHNKEALFRLLCSFLQTIQSLDGHLG